MMEKKKSTVFSGNVIDVDNANEYSMPDHIFSKFTKLIYEESGIKLNETKKLMLSARLSKRLRKLEINSFVDYYDYLINSENKKDELIKMIDVVSTNKTEFFREEAHFAFIKMEVLPVLAKERDLGEKAVNIWSAGCSSGEEPYTVAIVCAEFFKTFTKFRITATDISTKVLEIAKQAIYHNSQLEAVQENLLKKYFMKGKGEQEGYHKIVPELQKAVTIRRHNMVNEDFNSIPRMDIIFCRNVVIYFDRNTQLNLHQKLINHLNKGGYLFIGHSETLFGIRDDVERIAPTIYRKK